MNSADAQITSSSEPPGCRQKRWWEVMVMYRLLTRARRQTRTLRLPYCCLSTRQSGCLAACRLVVFHCCYLLHCISGYYIDAQEQHSNLMVWEKDKQTTYLESCVKSVCASTAVPSGPIEQMPLVPELIHVVISYWSTLFICSAF